MTPQTSFQQQFKYIQRFIRNDSKFISDRNLIIHNFIKNKSYFYITNNIFDVLYELFRQQ